MFCNWLGTILIILVDEYLSSNFPRVVLAISYLESLRQMDVKLQKLYFEWIF